MKEVDFVKNVTLSCEISQKLFSRSKLMHNRILKIKVLLVIQTTFKSLPFV